MNYRAPVACVTSIIFSLCLLTACGGGGGSSSSSGTSAANSSVAVDPSARSTTKLPTFEITSGNDPIVNEPKVTVTLKVTEYTPSNQPLVTYEGLAGAEYRGSSSQYFNQLFDANGQPLGVFKKSIGFETRDANGKGVGVPLLGLPTEEDWVLLAPFSDKTLLRDTLVYSLARDMGNYASRYKYVELYLNTEYKGIYILLEKIKRDANRLNISHLKVTDNSGEELTGGYILKLDKTSGEDPLHPDVEDVYNDSFSFISQQVDDEFNNRHHFIYNEPKSENITGPQKDYIQQYVHQFEAALAGSNYKDPTVGYRNFIEVDTFIDYFILNELSRNVDGFSLSHYLYKDKNKKIALGPVWDFNLAFGNALWCGAERMDGWAYNHALDCPGATAFPVPFWWSRLLSDPYFVDKLKARWTSLRASTLSNTQIFDKINTISAQLNNTNAVKDNYSKWPILGVWVWPNSTTPATYDGEISQLKFWLQNRAQWLDTNISAL